MSVTHRNRPGGPMATRPLHFIWILDRSGSMKHGGKIQALNNAIREACPHMKAEADANPNARLLVRAVTFSTGAQWHVAQPTPIAEFRWQDVTADGETQLGAALRLVADQLKMPPMEKRALPPVLVLISDGQPTDDYASGVKALLDEPWGRRAIRLAIAIGKDVKLGPLERFMAHEELRPLRAENVEALTHYIRWCSTLIRSASAPPAQGAKGPVPPDPSAHGSADQRVW